MLQAFVRSVFVHSYSSSADAQLVNLGQGTEMGPERAGGSGGECKNESESVLSLKSHS